MTVNKNTYGLKTMKKPKRKPRPKGNNLRTIIRGDKPRLVQHHKWDEDRIAMVKYIGVDDKTGFHKYKVYEIDTKTNQMRYLFYLGDKNSKLFKGWNLWR